jgi:hypothetical protein
LAQYTNESARFSELAKGRIRNRAVERNAVRAAGGDKSLPLVKRTQEPRDQRTGSIKCSYFVPGHIT